MNADSIRRHFRQRYIGRAYDSWSSVWNVINLWEFNILKEQKRNRASSIYRVLGLIQFTLGLLLLILGVVGQSYHGDIAQGGAHYFSGAFLVGCFVIILSILDIAIYFRGQRCYSRERAIKRMTCLLQAYSVVVALTFVCCITGTIITGLSGICKGDNCVYQENQTTNYGIAVAILSTIGIVFLTCVFGLVILCTHGHYFGVTIFKRGQNRISNTSSSPVSMRGIGPFVIPTGQESDEIRANQASLGISLQTQLERQNQREYTRTREISSELPPIRGSQRQIFLYDPHGQTPANPPQREHDSRDHTPISQPQWDLDPRGQAPATPPDSVCDPRGQTPATPPDSVCDPRGQTPATPPQRTQRRQINVHLPVVSMDWWPPPDEDPPPYSP